MLSGNTSHEYYGDIEDFDTSEVTNMDELFMNRAVPDISKWDVSAGDIDEEHVCRVYRDFCSN